jgi:hypothetical protein
MLKEIEIPAEFAEFASGFYEGSDSMLYAITSTGNLEIGSIRPYDCDTDEKWQLNLFETLDMELCHLLRAMRRTEKTNCQHYDICHRFQKWAEIAANTLRTEYGLDDE